jgi:tetratricopeptide (TPR) repeat protein
VAAIDEASARAALAVMQDRLARDPATALGLTSGATPDDLRHAFLELTKQFHPVRFGRMAIDIQKQSNEVFLALRAAHDSLAKTLRRQSGPIPTRPVPPSSPIPVVASRATHPRVAPLLQRTQRMPGPNETGERAPVQPPPAASGARPAVRPVLPQQTPSRPLGAVRPVAAPQLVTVRDETVVIDLLNRQQWDQARTALHQLAARDPSSKRIRALAAYARGREAQLDGRVDDARVELQDALELEPDLQLAKTALTELFTRRK